MLKKLTVSALLALFAWNALLGTFGGMVLCLHSDGSMHTEEEVLQLDHCCEADAGHQLSSLAPIDCSDCTDVEIRGTELPPMRTGERQLCKTPLPDAGSWIPASLPAPDRGTLLSPVNSRAPPEIPAIAVMVSRTTVQRL